VNRHLRLDFLPFFPRPSKGMQTILNLLANSYCQSPR